MHAITSRRVETVEFLLDSGADVEAQDKVVGGRGMDGACLSRRREGFWTGCSVFRHSCLWVQGLHAMNAEKIVRGCFECVAYALIVYSVYGTIG